MRRLWSVVSALWSLLGWAILIGAGWQMGAHAGYGRGARDIAALIHEMRQGATETPEPWTHGGI